MPTSGPSFRQYVYYLNSSIIFTILVDLSMILIKSKREAHRIHMMINHVKSMELYQVLSSTSSAGESVKYREVKNLMYILCMSTKDLRDLRVPAERWTETAKEILRQDWGQLSHSCLPGWGHVQPGGGRGDEAGRRGREGGDVSSSDQAQISGECNK